VSPEPHTLRWYWTLYKQSDHWLGDLSVGLQGLSDMTRLQRTGLIESLLFENGEKRFAVMTRKVIKEEMKARTPSQPGNLLSALRGMIRWMIDEHHLDEDDDPTIGLRSGKAKASRESGGFLPWTEEDMALYQAKWPLGTEARLMFDILHLRAARAAGIIGAEVFTGKVLKGRVLPMKQEGLGDEVQKIRCSGGRQ
jgi:hypothetical protein